MKNIKAIFLKQMKDTLRNKPVLIQFVLFPALVLIFENAVNIENMPEHFFAKLFAVMFVGMAPLTCMSALIAEEKEKNTLRVLLMSGVKPAEYLIGTGAYVFVMCLAGTAVFAAAAGFGGSDLILFVGVMLAGIILSELAGALIGVSCKNQMTASSVSIPVMMLISFLPMLSMFNDTIRSFAAVTYSQQISDLINGIGAAEVKPLSLAVIGLYLVAETALFMAVYKRRGLD